MTPVSEHEKGAYSHVHCVPRAEINFYGMRNEP